VAVSGTDLVEWLTGRAIIRSKGKTEVQLRQQCRGVIGSGERRLCHSREDGTESSREGSLDSNGPHG